jgi:hypothetical protein
MNERRWCFHITSFTGVPFREPHAAVVIDGLMLWLELYRPRIFDEDFALLVSLLFAVGD